MPQKSRAEGNSKQVGRDESSVWKILTLFDLNISLLTGFNWNSFNNNIANNNIAKNNKIQILLGLAGVFAFVLAVVLIVGSWEKNSQSNVPSSSPGDFNVMGSMSMLGSPNKANSSSPKNAPTASNTKAGTTKNAASIRGLHHSRNLIDDLSPNRAWARLKNLSPNDEWWSLEGEGAATGMYDVENLDLDNVYGWRFENGVLLDFTSEPLQVFLDRTTGALTFGVSGSSKLIDESTLRMPELMPGMPESVLEMPASKPDMLESVLGMPESEPGMPESESEIPESESGVPELVADLPESESGMPELVTEIPESVPGMPEPVSGMLELVADLPESEPEIPELMPEMLELATEIFDSVPSVPEPSFSPYGSIPIGIGIFFLRRSSKKC